MTRSLRLALTLFMLALSLIPALSVAMVFSLGIFQKERDLALDLQRQSSERAQDLLLGYLDGVQAELNALAMNRQLRAEVRTEREALLRQTVFYRGNFDELIYLSMLGGEQAYVTRLGVTTERTPRNLSDNPLFFEPIRTGRIYYHGVERSVLNGEPLLVLSLPTLSTITSHANGVLVARVRLGRVLNQITRLPLGERGAIMLSDDAGQIIAHPNPDLLGSVAPLPPADGLAVNAFGERILQVRYPISMGPIKLFVRTELPLEEADANLREALVTATVLLLILTLAIAVLCILIARRITQPVVDLAAAARRLSAGELELAVAVTRRDELGELQTTFNQMVSNLRGQRVALEARTDELQASVERQQALLDTVARLSIPLLPVWEGVVVLPLVGHVDEARGADLLAALMQGVVERRARVVILDITGLSSLDDTVLHTLIQAAQAIKLLGAHAVLAGISADAAQYVVASGVELKGLACYRDLASATTAAIGDLGRSSRV
ncbi:MAG: HAMP domain-containing protein [Candidatus Viridilinea halotolerans]|uniref:HAMP domain-containing protein n=1 Tax=Candidatus Viridilinea halotolerans TaxID=2491704 RepID=A0A426TQ52_9CHLR|nr:MAG: HAMP domain-containing protein [Candidatus Viridilinea halotolerans]